MAAQGFLRLFVRASLAFGFFVVAGWRHLSSKNFTHARQRVDITDGLVVAQAHDSRETQGEAGVVAVGFLDVIEGDFHDDDRFDVANVTVIFDGVLEEKLREVSDFGVGHAGVGLADVDEAACVFAFVGIANSEGVVGQQPAALAVTIFVAANTGSS